MNIALDAMGGDHAPEHVVAGALLAAPLVTRSTITLVGDPVQIARYLPRPCPVNISVTPASETIGMHETPTEALRKKKDSSIVIGARLIKEGAAQAFVSAGNTGAVTAACLLMWRQIQGVHRPAIASLMPRLGGNYLLLDAGASPDVDPDHLVEFAILGRAYAQRVLGIPQPRVHLLNIGEEPGKGNAFAKQAYHLLSAFDWFTGNIEGKDMFMTDCDVVICDAFVGNIVLKTGEGVAEFMMQTIKEQMPKGRLAQLLFLPMRRVMGPLQKRLDYAEYGGSPLLGLNGLCVICHGRSNPKAIKNALLNAQIAIENDLIAAIREVFCMRL